MAEKQLKECSASAIGKDMPMGKSKDNGNNKDVPQLIKYIIDGDNRALESRLRDGENPDFAFKSKSLVMLSALHKRIDMLRLLNEHGASLNATSSQMMTGFMYAICAGNEQEAEYLRRSGADPRIENSRHMTAHDLFRTFYEPNYAKGLGHDFSPEKAARLLKLSDPKVALFAIEEITRSLLRKDIDRFTGLPLREIVFKNGAFTYVERIFTDADANEVALNCVKDETGRSGYDWLKYANASIGHTWERQPYIKICVNGIRKDEIAIVQTEVMQIAQKISFGSSEFIR